MLKLFGYLNLGNRFNGRAGTVTIVYAFEAVQGVASDMPPLGSIPKVHCPTYRWGRSESRHFPAMSISLVHPSPYLDALLWASLTCLFSGYGFSLI